MSEPSSPSHEVKRWTILSREYVEYSDGRTYYRKIKPNTGMASDWQEIIAESSALPGQPLNEPRILYLVLRSQAEGEPKHWCLFVSHGGTIDSKGQIWQVTGDATMMHYQHESGVSVFDSGSYYTSYSLNSDLSKDEETLIQEAVEKEAPPHAKDRRSVKEHCQGWTIRVLRRLEEEGVIKQGSANWIEADLKEPVNN